MVSPKWGHHVGVDGGSIRTREDEGLKVDLPTTKGEEAITDDLKDKNQSKHCYN